MEDLCFWCMQILLNMNVENVKIMCYIINYLINIENFFEITTYKNTYLHLYLNPLKISNV